jgi:hypothetical protein
MLTASLTPRFRIGCTRVYEKPRKLAGRNRPADYFTFGPRGETRRGLLGGRVTAAVSQAVGRKGRLGVKEWSDRNVSELEALAFTAAKPEAGVSQRFGGIFEAVSAILQFHNAVELIFASSNSPLLVGGIVIHVSL